MILETVLANYSHWRTPLPLKTPPEIVTQLHWGTVHHAVKVMSETEAGPAEFVVRFLSRAETSLARPFEQEIALLRAAADAELAPAVVYVQPQNRLLVSEFIDGEREVEAAALGRLLRAIHALPATTERLDLAAQLAFYTDRALTRGVDPALLVDPEFSPLQNAILQLSLHPEVTCHNDLGQGNVLQAGTKTMAIDWEYAGTCSAYFDAASACAGWPDLDEGEILAEVFPRNFSPLLWQYAKAIYAATEWNWYQASGVARPERCNQERVQELLAALP